MITRVVGDTLAEARLILEQLVENRGGLDAAEKDAACTLVRDARRVQLEDGGEEGKQVGRKRAGRG